MAARSRSKNPRRGGGTWWFPVAKVSVGMSVLGASAAPELSGGLAALLGLAAPSVALVVFVAAAGLLSVS